LFQQFDDQAEACSYGKACERIHFVSRTPRARANTDVAQRLLHVNMTAATGVA